MKSIKFIILGVILISLIISSFPYIANGSTFQKKDIHLLELNPAASFGFFETYTWTEALSGLDQANRFFQLIDTKGVDRTGSKLGTCLPSDSSELWALIHSDSFQKQVPKDLRFAWNVQEGEQGRALYALKESKEEYSGPVQADIKELSVQKSERGNDYGLYISFSKTGTEKWATMTRDNVGRDIAILFDGKVYAAPRVTEAITFGKCVISGDFTESEINKLIAALE